MRMRRKFDEQLNHLNNKLIEMAETVKHAITLADRALIEQDVELAQAIIDSEGEIDKQEKEIEKFCLEIILQQQPVASDLRLISAVQKIITDLERIGDHAEDISEITIHLAGKQYMKKMEHITQMAAATMKMVTDSIDAFVKKDIDLAKQVIAYDDEIDELFKKVKKDLIELLNRHPDNGDQAIDLIMAAKYFERIGDHAENIAERVVFSLTGIRKNSKIM
jgi:phosphate transport system protein